jgi:hypothetical protein
MSVMAAEHHGIDLVPVITLSPQRSSPRRCSSAWAVSPDE